MDQALFNLELPAFSGKIENPALQDSLSQLKEIAGEIKLLQWAENRLAIPITLKIDLPSLGTHEDIDIRPEEPVIFVFDTVNYPTKAPFVYTDRLDFPKDRLAHLYIATAGRPPAFCYQKGSTDHWYANKTIKDLTIRIRNWLREAATGELAGNNEQFDPLRLEGYSGLAVYDYDFFANVVHKNQRVFPEVNFAIGLFDGTEDNENFTFNFIKLATPENIEEVKAEVEVEKKKDQKAKDKRNLRYGYIIWSDSEKSHSNYQIEWPKSWTEFKAFCELYDIDHKLLETFICASKINYLAYFPVIVAIKRPANVIGFSSNIEFANFGFTVYHEDFNEGHFIKDIPVVFHSHNQSLTRTLASRISGIEGESERKLIFGCGALGSKIVMHLARSGHLDMALQDPDSISGHNMTRHALLSNKIGVNKARALKQEIEKMYPSENLSVQVNIPLKGTDFFAGEKFEPFDCLLDFTASPAFFNQLAAATNLSNMRVFSSNISDFGNLGITLIEGENRNPRIDDLQVSLYSQYSHNSKISDWLKREADVAIPGNILISVGVGCNSETTVLSDIKVSSHASFAAGILVQEIKSNTGSGKIFLNRIQESPTYNLETSSFEVKPFYVLNAVNDKNWSIRFANGVIEDMERQMKRAGKKETGGIFVGISNYKTKVIHVTELLPAPLDSSGTALCFCRGVKGLPDRINLITENTGGQLGYIGEWHSHPHGPDSLSDIDLATVERFKKEFSTLPMPLPVFLTIITPRVLLPYVF